MGSVPSSVLAKMEVWILAFSLNLQSLLGTGKAHDRQLGVGEVFWQQCWWSLWENRVCENASNSFSQPLFTIPSAHAQLELGHLGQAFHRVAFAGARWESVPIQLIPLPKKQL